MELWTSIATVVAVFLFACFCGCKLKSSSKKSSNIATAVVCPKKAQIWAQDVTLIASHLQQQHTGINFATSILTTHLRVEVDVVGPAGDVIPFVSEMSIRKDWTVDVQTGTISGSTAVVQHGFSLTATLKRAISLLNSNDQHAVLFALDKNILASLTGLSRHWYLHLNETGADTEHYLLTFTGKAMTIAELKSDADKIFRNKACFQLVSTRHEIMSCLRVQPGFTVNSRWLAAKAVIQEIAARFGQPVMSGALNCYAGPNDFYGDYNVRAILKKYTESNPSAQYVFADHKTQFELLDRCMSSTNMLGALDVCVLERVVGSNSFCMDSQRHFIDFALAALLPTNIPTSLSAYCQRVSTSAVPSVALSSSITFTISTGVKKKNIQPTGLCSNTIFQVAVDNSSNRNQQTLVPQSYKQQLTTPFAAQHRFVNLATDGIMLDVCMLQDSAGKLLCSDDILNHSFTEASVSTALGLLSIVNNQLMFQVTSSAIGTAKKLCDVIGAADGAVDLVLPQSSP
eukprot:TRINITY_DN1878_c0_g1_i1.p1 TRINITY_DN1878_c0_g1~~TRINITY_DN1878_c0_g1_i1.p1  ORF type:complete len:531 (-),score=69.37 TRINITY_DN1878_c0_g1_i1:1249-2790(-)